MTNVAHLLRGLLLPVFVASAMAAATALPAAAAVRSVDRRSVDSQPAAGSGQWWLAALHVPAAPLRRPQRARASRSPCSPPAWQPPTLTWLAR